MSDPSRQQNQEGRWVEGLGADFVLKVHNPFLKRDHIVMRLISVYMYRAIYKIT